MNIAFFTSAQPEQPIGLNFAEKLFPIGVGFLLSILKRRGNTVDFYDRYLTKDRSFPAEEYDLVCIYSNTPCFKDTLAIIKHYRDKMPIVVGGPHTSIYPETLKGIDYIVQGEGENAMQDIAGGSAPKGVLKYPRIEDLDILPLSDYELFSKMPYQTHVKWFPDTPVYSYNSSRGCPFDCTFCDVKRIWGKKYTYFSAPRVMDDIEYLIRRYGVKGIYFREDNFTCNRKRLVEICELILKHGINYKWVCETRVDTVDEETISLMARAGCKAFYIGFESGAQHMLDVYHKGTTVEQGLKTAELANKYEIKIAGSFIFNHPLETAQDKKDTQIFIHKAKLSVAWMNKYRTNFDKYVEEVMRSEND